MNRALRELGMTDELEAKFKRRHIRTSEQLLEAARTPAARQDLAKAMGVDGSVILELARRADLARVKGIGPVLADLLAQADVDSLQDLASCRPDDLQSKLIEVNTQKRVAWRLPDLGSVEDWIAQARQLPKILE